MRYSLRRLALSGLACCALNLALPATAALNPDGVFPEHGALQLVLSTIGSARESSPDGVFLHLS